MATPPRWTPQGRRVVAPISVGPGAYSVHYVFELIVFYLDRFVYFFTTLLVKDNCILLSGNLRDPPPTTTTSGTPGGRTVSPVPAVTVGGGCERVGLPGGVPGGTATTTTTTSLLHKSDNRLVVAGALVKDNCFLKRSKVEDVFESLVF